MEKEKGFLLIYPEGLSTSKLLTVESKSGQKLIQTLAFSGLAAAGIVEAESFAATAPLGAYLKLNSVDRHMVAVRVS